MEIYRSIFTEMVDEHDRWKLNQIKKIVSRLLFNGVITSEGYKNVLRELE